MTLLVIALILQPPTTNHQSPAHAAETPSYALITAENAVLYRQTAPLDTPEGRFFRLPMTYFVEILDSLPQAETGTLRVKYDGVTGYVKAEDVAPVDYTPRSLYPQGLKLHFNVDAPSLYLRARPISNAAQVIAVIPSDTRDVRYYNTVSGDVAGGTGEWFFVRVLGEEGELLYGYVSAAYCVVDTAIDPENDTSAVPVTVTPGPNPDPNGEPADMILVLLIAAISIPAVITVFLVFRPRKRIPVEKE